MKAKTVDKYIAGAPRKAQKRLREIRGLIEKIEPKAEERISYAIPAFFLNNKMLVYFAAFKNHVSIFPFTKEMGVSMKESKNYETSGKGTVRFPLDKPLPTTFIQKIVRQMVKNNLARTKK